MPALLRGLTFVKKFKEDSRKTGKLADIKTLAMWGLQSHVGMAFLSLVLAIIFLIGLILIFGAHPFEVIGTLAKGAVRGQAAIISTLEEAGVLLLASLAILIPIKGGFFNISAQGQLEMGGFVSAIVAIYCPGPDFLVIILSMLAGMAAAILVSLIPLALRHKRGASEVTTGIMVNFICSLFVYAMIYGPFMEEGSFYATTRRVPQGRMIPDLFGVHIGVYVTLLLCIAAYLMMKKTSYGLKLNATGFNQRASTVLGISVNKVMNSGVFLGAAMAGLAGAMEVLGVTARVTHGWASNWGFTGVCIAFLGGNALGLIPIALLLSVIGVGGRHMQAMTGVPVSLVDILKGLPVVIFLILTAIRKTKPDFGQLNLNLFNRRRAMHLDQVNVNDQEGA